MSAHVCFAVGTERYGIAVEHVREVAELGSIIPVPGSGPLVTGVRNLRGEILPVVRLHSLLGAPARNPSRIVVVQDGDRSAGFAVDRADDVEELAEPQAPGQPLTRGAVLHNGSVVGIVDVPAVLDAVAARAGA
jgi:purine-binding chemotaxis protein CheW